MAAESGAGKKPPRSTKATPKKRAGAAAKPAKSAAVAKPAKSASSAAKQAKRASEAAKGPAKQASAATKRARPASSAKPKPKPAPAAKPVPAAEAVPAAKPTPVARKPARAPAKRTVAKETAQSYFDALAARDAGGAARVWADDAVDDLIPLGIFRGQAAIQALFEEMFVAVPDARFSVERIIADGKVAAVQWRVAGTFTGGTFQGLEPTGRRVDLRGTDCLDIEDGKIVHNTGVFDGAAFARQVGLLPPEDSGADRAIRAGFNTVTKLRRTMARRTAR